MNSLTDRIGNLVTERWLGISTRGHIPTNHPDSVHYATMNYRTIRKVLRQLELGRDDVFVDVGCGKGRVLCMAALYPVSLVAGVDLAEELCVTARANAGRMNGRVAPVTVIVARAQDFDYSQATVLFLFDPFGAATCEVVLERIRRDTAGRTVRIAYANPTHAEVFDRQPWLERTETWDRESTGLEQSVVFYRTRSGADRI